MSRASTFQHPLWLVGFRPFFILAFISGALLPLIWALAFSGLLPLPATAPGPIAWHAHEMLFGFGWAVLGGFLLTASKNWVHIRGLHGGPLALAALLWIVERVAVLTAGGLPSPIAFVLLNAFLLFVAGYVLWSLVRYRKQDTFKDNYFFMVALPLFFAAKNMILSPEYYIYGWSLALGLIRLAFAVMFERTMTQFMKNSMGTAILRNKWLDTSIKSTVLLSAFQAFLPLSLATGILALASILLAVRFFKWKPIVGFKKFEIAIMYVGYLGLTVHLALEALGVSGTFSGIGALSPHVFTFLCMGIVIPGMMIRISQGHTGRKLVFTRSDRFAIGSMGAASFFRLIATQVWPESYSTWIALSGIGWSICFVVVGARLTPFLLRARIDNRDH